MHFSIGETQDLRDESGRLYTIYTIAINGANHCSVRYSQLNNLNEQLIQEFGAKHVPAFPAKKVFTLTETSKLERKYQLETFFQQLSRSQSILNSNVFSSFFANAQQETNKEPETDLDVNIYLMNFEKITIIVKSYDQTDDILEKFGGIIGLDSNLVHYFSLFLVKKDENESIEIVRELQAFESPCISLKEANRIEKHKLLVRKSTFDKSLESRLYDDKMALNLLYIQATAELDWDWIKPSPEVIDQLEELEANKSKKKFLALISSQKFYGCVHLRPSVSDYPEANTKARISIGNHFITLAYVQKKQIQEYDFKVTRIRSWKIISVKSEANKILLEFSFEYLMKKDTFQWITFQTDQSILLGMCLQSMVDEIVMKKSGQSYGDLRHRPEKQPFLTRNKAIKDKRTGNKAKDNSSATTALGAAENDIFENDDFISNDDL